MSVRFFCWLKATQAEYPSASDTPIYTPTLHELKDYHRANKMTGKYQLYDTKSATNYYGMYRMAEGMGFEPTIRLTSYNGLAIRRLQPLGHPSAWKAVFILRS